MVVEGQLGQQKMVVPVEEGQFGLVKLEVEVRFEQVNLVVQGLNELVKLEVLVVEQMAEERFELVVVGLIVMVCLLMVGEPLVVVEHLGKVLNEMEVVALHDSLEMVVQVVEEEELMAKEVLLMLN